jgi:hypothetical protein
MNYSDFSRVAAEATDQTKRDVSAFARDCYLQNILIHIGKVLTELDGNENYIARVDRTFDMFPPPDKPPLGI